MIRVIKKLIKTIMFLLPSIIKGISTLCKSKKCKKINLKKKKSTATNKRKVTAEKKDNSNV